MILAEAVISGAAGAVTELKLRMLCLGPAADCTFALVNALSAVRFALRGVSRLIEIDDIG